ncbi:DUF4145 domain-containing protein [Acinetobacter thermotolerans]|uniref:DUF4145 domain-containing protein n=2 Tax=Acinetobacter thermotolerans TaxID=3151487 RepID=UPI00325AA961
MHHKCGDKVIVCGEGTIEENYTDYILTEEGYCPCEREFIDVFTPRYFQPALNLFKVPDKVPSEIKDIIYESFALTLSSPSSAVNKLRIAIEILLTEFGIQGKDRKGAFVSLDQRIKSIEQNHILFPQQQLLLAIKWLGNSGSHEENAIFIDELFDAFQIIEKLLNNLYSYDRILEMAQLISQKKQPLTRKERAELKK